MFIRTFYLECLHTLETYWDALKVYLNPHFVEAAHCAKMHHRIRESRKLKFIFYSNPGTLSSDLMEDAA